jgi:hypothetical protein
MCKIGDGYIQRLLYLRLLTVKCQQSITNTSVTLVFKVIESEVSPVRNKHISHIGTYGY